jgi:PAS domain S-box-containing protein
MEIPAAICKDLYVWSGNKAWADLCGVDKEQLIGAGVEEFIHPDSLKMVVNYNKKMQQGDASNIFKHQVFFERKNGSRIRVFVSISPLKRPSGTLLAIAENGT